MNRKTTRKGPWKKFRFSRSLQLRGSLRVKQVKESFSVVRTPENDALILSFP